jgi:mono/diheme cytochrome c family protein
VTSTSSSRVAMPPVATSASAAAVDAAPPTAAEGHDLVVRMECGRCHALPEATPPPREKQCVGCHEDIVTGRFAAPPATLAKWKPHVQHLRFAPSLEGAGALLRPAWIADYLMAPRDLRPGLHATMPRLAIDRRGAQAIATWLEKAAAHAPPGPAVPHGDADRGRRHFTEKGCATCHAFSRTGTPAPPTVRPDEGADRALAPDLRWTRERVRPDLLARWILDPASVKRDAVMPKQEVSAAEAADLAAFVATAPLERDVARERPLRLPVLDRPVAYDEVASRVLHRICWHCHSQPDFARGDGGPGNTGGLGFAPRRVDLASYESIAAGYLDARGEAASLFSPAPGSDEPVLLAVLLTRQDEERGQLTTLRGMPLGLPALSPQEIQLVESWIAQGHPR